ncbi:uncharacterized protein ALTATR162_LOCUS7733 [Alternaria atra]|uniref:Uncharacterized protein n=1 Tax=Alternaria atra TaxID=119953 RepID=A0A8J2N3U1_9PLEO|nr:uncharacterized protein ALTATR162_LOCUS7733 [Alternaria atra]CAG5174120.1 unnamed protein product [Alternaria atra]
MSTSNNNRSKERHARDGLSDTESILPQDSSTECRRVDTIASASRNPEPDMEIRRSNLALLLIYTSMV